MKSQPYEVTDAAPRDLESGRVRRAFSLPAAYVELLDLAAALPVEAGPRSVVRAVVETLSNALVGRGVGACVAVPGTDVPVVETYLPPNAAQPGRDPARLFPEFEDEVILTLDRLPGSTLHVAAPEGTLSIEERSAVQHAAAILSTGVRTSVAIVGTKAATDVQTLRAQLIQAEKLASLGQIVAGVVHELANPITSIVASTDFLLRKSNSVDVPTEELEHLKRIGIAADRILKFSRDLIDYARPARETPSAVGLHDVVAQAHAFSQHELERHGVEFSADYMAGSPPVLGQAGPLTQLFVNLFTNAAHAMSAHGGRLFVRTRLEAETALVVEVTDTGIGIPEETLGKIFDPFFTTKEAGQGTGLGLSIVREIAEAHGGVVEAASTPGEGTTFVVRLPLYDGR